MPLESLNHPSDRGGVYRLYSSRDLHTDVQNLKTGKPNNDTPPLSEIVSAYKYVSLFFCLARFIEHVLSSSFNVQVNNQLQLTDFLNSVGQLKYRGTSVLFRLGTNVQDLLRMCKYVAPVLSFIFHPIRTESL